MAQRHRRILVASDDGILPAAVPPIAQDGVLEDGTMSTSHIDAVPIPCRRGAGRTIPIGVTTYAVIFVGGENHPVIIRPLSKQRAINS